LRTTVGPNRYVSTKTGGRSERTRSFGIVALHRTGWVTYGWSRVVWAIVNLTEASTPRGLFLNLSTSPTQRFGTRPILAVRQSLVKGDALRLSRRSLGPKISPLRDWETFFGRQSKRPFWTEQALPLSEDRLLVALLEMDHQYPPQDPNVAGNPMAKQPTTGATRGRGRRAYAAQQYDFNAPGMPAAYDQQQYQYPSGQGYPQAYPQQQPADASSPPPYLQQQGYPQQHQYGQDYKAAGGSPQTAYPQQPYPGQPGVAGMTQQFQQMHVAQVLYSHSPPFCHDYRRC